MDEPEKVELSTTRMAEQSDLPVEGPPASRASGDRTRHTRRTRLTVAAAVVAVIAMVGSVTVAANAWTHHPSTAALPAIPTKAAVTPRPLAHDRWSVLPAAPIKARSGAVGEWTGTQMFVWGGASGRGDNVLHADGATYDPATKTWSTLPSSPLSARTWPVSVWTGRSVFIWGGEVRTDGTGATDGALYTPVDHSWTRVPRPPITGYDQAQAFWTGSVIVLLSTPVRTPKGITRVYAQSFDPVAGSWVRLPDLRFPAGRGADGVVELGAGNRIYLWSKWSRGTDARDGSFEITGHVDGYTFNTDSRTWAKNSLAVPAGMVSSTPLWTGSNIILPAIQHWYGLVPTPAPMKLAGSTVDPTDASTRPIAHGPVDDLNAEYLWTGTALLAFNTSAEISGPGEHAHPGEAASWSPASRKWTRLPNAPLAARNPVAVWTGTSLLIWGQLFQPSTQHDVATSGLQFVP